MNDYATYKYGINSSNKINAKSQKKLLKFQMRLKRLKGIWPSKLLGHKLRICLVLHLFILNFNLNALVDVLLLRCYYWLACDALGLDVEHIIKKNKKEKRTKNKQEKKKKLCIFCLLLPKRP